jgi:HEAT repeat protein
MEDCARGADAITMRRIAASALVWLGILSLALCLGCADGPFRRLWYYKEWQQDEQYGPTYHTRMQEMKTLRGSASQYGEEEQARLAKDLNDKLAKETCPSYRREIVQTLGALKVPAAMDGLRLAVKDSDPNVRIAGCEAWGQRGGEEALRTLSETVGADANLDVRMAATRELARFRRPEAIRALGVALDDPNPALQYCAVQSLKRISGQDLGNNVAAWRQFVHEGTVPQLDQPTIAERLRNLF